MCRVGSASAAAACNHTIIRVNQIPLHCIVVVRTTRSRGARHHRRHFNETLSARGTILQSVGIVVEAQRCPQRGMLHLGRVS